MAFVLYFVVNGEGDAPDTFSLTSWALMIVPPSALAAVLLLGFWLRDDHASVRRALLSRVSAVVATAALSLTVLFSLLVFFGELMDYAIG